jgi:hypothetical protein
MRIVDTDRCLYARETWVRATADGHGACTAPAPPRVSLGRLDPPTCTPKASVLLLQRPLDLEGPTAVVVTD